MKGIRRGFTLIELLVVIAIIAILAAILFPMLMAAKQKGQQSACMSNMMQIGKAINMYADDAHGYTPFGYCVNPHWGVWNKDTWRERIVPYARSKRILVCGQKTRAPGAEATHYPPPNKYWPDYCKYSHYGLNIYVVMPSNGEVGANAGYRLLSSIPASAQTILVTENKDGDWSGEPWDNYGTGDEGQFWPYHGTKESKGGNFTFCDGHASFMTIARTQMTLSGVAFFYWKVRKVP